MENKVYVSMDNKVKLSLNYPCHTFLSGVLMSAEDANALPNWAIYFTSHAILCQKLSFTPLKIGLSICVFLKLTSHFESLHMGM